ncbi:MAG TPA: hypothetical protein VFZ49_06255 [Pyrinomonadaceae bacterium]
MAVLFEEKKPFASSAVWACVVYSLVPLVGVVFFPFTLVFGIAAVLRGDALLRRSALVAMAAGAAILVVQLVLWWLLFMVPRWGGMGA